MVTGSSLFSGLLAVVWFLLRALDERRRISARAIRDGKPFHEMNFFRCFSANLTILGEQILWMWSTSALIQEIL